MTFSRDLLERVLRTFIAAVLVTAAAGWADVTDVSSAKALGISAVMAGVTMALGLAAKLFGDPESASFIKPPPG